MISEAIAKDYRLFFVKLDLVMNYRPGLRTITHQRSPTSRPCHAARRGKIRRVNTYEQDKNPNGEIDINILLVTADVRGDS